MVVLGKVRIYPRHPRSCHCPPCKLLRYIHGLSTVSAHSPRSNPWSVSEMSGSIEGVHSLPRSVHEFSTVFPLSIHGISTVCPRPIHGFPWSFHGPSTVSKVAPAVVFRFSRVTPRSYPWYPRSFPRRPWDYPWYIHGLHNHPHAPLTHVLGP